MSAICLKRWGQKINQSINYVVCGKDERFSEEKIKRAKVLGHMGVGISISPKCFESFCKGICVQRFER